MSVLKKLVIGISLAVLFTSSSFAKASVSCEINKKCNFTMDKNQKVLTVKIINISRDSTTKSIDCAFENPMERTAFIINSLPFRRDIGLDPRPRLVVSMDFPKSRLSGNNSFVIRATEIGSEHERPGRPLQLNVSCKEVNW